MNARSIVVAAAVALLAPVLAAGCGAPPEGGETEGSTSEAILPVTGGGSCPNCVHKTIECGSFWSWNMSDHFQATLAAYGCSEPESAWATTGSTAVSVTTCPATSGVVTFVNDYNLIAPYDSVVRTAKTTLCSNGVTPIKSGDVEVLFDPNCSGTVCGKAVLW